MRASAKWIMGVVAFFFVGWMIYGYGMDIAGRGAAQSNVIAKVNGRSIDAQTFYGAVRNEQERRRAQDAPAPTTLAEQQQLENDVLEQLVQDVVLQDEFHRRGITVSDQEIIEAARTTPPPEVLKLPQFQTDSQFDFQKYQRFLASNVDPSFLMALEARYRDELPRIKLYEQLTAGMYVSDEQLWQTYRDQHDSATIALLQLMPQALAPDSAVQVTDAEIETYYRAHQQDFERPAAAHLSFVALPRRPNAADSAAALERVRALRKEIVEGTPFADVASRESADSVSRKNGGDLGDVPKGSFVREFEDPALALRPGELSQPFETQYGWHLVELVSKTDSTIHARHILIPIELAGEHLTKVESEADTLDLFAADQEDPTALDRVAAELGLSVATAPVLHEGERLQLGLYVVGDAGVWAFGGAQPGETSPVIETQWAYYVFRLDSLTPAGVAPLAEVRDEVQRLATTDKQTATLKLVADSIGKEIAGGTTLETVANRRGLTVRTLGPFTRYTPPPALQGMPEVVGAAFRLGIGQTGGPIMTPFGASFLRPIKKTLADSAAFASSIESLRTAAIQQARQARVQLMLASLRENAKVDDRRAALERAQREAQAKAPQTPNGKTR